MIAVSIPSSVVLEGAILGLNYGLLAVGLVLIYRTSRVVNFAQGQLGVVAAVFLVKLYYDYGINYWAALVAALALAAGGGRAVGARAPPPVQPAPGHGHGGHHRPVPGPLPLHPLPLHPAQEALPGLPGARSTGRFTSGRSSSRPERSSPSSWRPSWRSGSPPSSASRPGAWPCGPRPRTPSRPGCRGCGCGAPPPWPGPWPERCPPFTAILASPSQTSTLTQVLSPGLLLLALLAALLGGMVSLPVAFVAGIGVGVVQDLLQWNITNPSSGSATVELVLFVLLQLALLVRAASLQKGSRTAERTSWMTGTLGFRRTGDSTAKTGGHRRRARRPWSWPRCCPSCWTWAGPSSCPRSASTA